MVFCRDSGLGVTQTQFGNLPTTHFDRNSHLEIWKFGTDQALQNTVWPHNCLFEIHSSSDTHHFAFKLSWTMGLVTGAFVTTWASVHYITILLIKGCTWYALAVCYIFSCHLAPIGPRGPKLSTMHTAWRRSLLLESQPTSFGLILQEEKEEEEKEKRGFSWAAIRQ